MKIPLYHIDAFTDQLFRGNPAAVCPLEDWPEDIILQKIATENNLSETAFFVKTEDHYKLRWFTPKIEVDLCGHGTLASAFVIFTYMSSEIEKINFHTKSGILTVEKQNDLISMDFPSRKPEPVDCPPELSEGLGYNPTETLKARDYYAVFDNPDMIISIKPDFNVLERLETLGICITAKGNDVDFVSRFFAPRAGILEDPVTGSAHSSLIPFWAERLNKKTLHALQMSERGGELFCQDLGDRVVIAGKARTYSIGVIQI
jgi:PhzF family phenazine biosynthesis protein